MRIIDKNTDFYDYMQNVYRDDSVTFDRTNSFILTKRHMCEYLDRCWHTNLNFYFCLLQVCNTFWLFLLKATKSIQVMDFTALLEFGDGEYITDYGVELLSSWKSYSRPRTLCKLELIHFDWPLTRHFSTPLFPKTKDYDQLCAYAKSLIVDNVQNMIEAINQSNYKVDGIIDSHIVHHGDVCGLDDNQIETHIPLLIASGFAVHIDPQEIYLSFEEYFSSEKTASERTESEGLTDKEKIENHGFGIKKSFRGKIQK